MSFEHSSIENQGRYIPILIFFFIGIAPIYWFQWHGKSLTPPNVLRAANSRPGPADWFLILKVPEAPFGASETVAFKARFSGWLSKLSQQGFQPMLLSDVCQRLKYGVGLPEKAVVLVVDPGLAHTYEVIAPDLEWYKFPAVWLTRNEIIQNGDRRYLSQHQLDVMEKSKMWDIGFYEGFQKITVESRDYGKITLGNGQQGIWATTPGNGAVNRANHLSVLNRLNARVNWDEQEVVNRLLNDVPFPQGTAELTAHQIQNRAWGSVVTRGTSVTAAFNLRAPSDKRSLNVAWQGTRGVTDFDLQLDFKPVSGELWLLLRSDGRTGDSLHIGFTEDSIVVEEECNHVRRRITSAALSPFQHSDHINAEISLIKNQLKVSSIENQIINTGSFSPSSSRSGIVELFIYDKIRGTAAADSIRMIMTRRTES